MSHFCKSGMKIFLASYELDVTAISGPGGQAAQGLSHSGYVNFVFVHIEEHLARKVGTPDGLYLDRITQTQRRLLPCSEGGSNPPSRDWRSRRRNALRNARLQRSPYCIDTNRN